MLIMKGDKTMARQKSKRQICEDKNRCSVTMYCKYCGHTNRISASRKWRICSWCHRKINNTTQAHFTKTILELIKENNENEKNSI